MFGAGASAGAVVVSYVFAGAANLGDPNILVPLLR